MSDKKICGIRVCDCDHRFKPEIAQTRSENPFYYYVRCRNCGATGAPVIHNSGDSHIRAKQAAIFLWNDRNTLVIEKGEAA
jgi:hypothetical protein